MPRKKVLSNGFDVNEDLVLKRVDDGYSIFGVKIYGSTLIFRCEMEILEEANIERTSTIAPKIPEIPAIVRQDQKAEDWSKFACNKEFSDIILVSGTQEFPAQRPCCAASGFPRVRTACRNDLRSQPCCGR